MYSSPTEYDFYDFLFYKVKKEKDGSWTITPPHDKHEEMSARDLLVNDFKHKAASGFYYADSIPLYRRIGHLRTHSTPNKLLAVFQEAGSP